MMNNLIIAGRADCLLDDIEALHKTGIGDQGSWLRGLTINYSPFTVHCSFDYMAIGLHSANRFSWRIEYVATYHPIEIPKIRQWREAIGGNTDYKVISHEKRPDVDIFEPFKPPSGSSALLGTLAAIRLGYNKIILCGCPMTGISPEAKANYETFREGWTVKKKDIREYVRSMSGWTKELLGEPTREWLRSEQ